jgi:hypothetical protein
VDLRTENAAKAARRRFEAREFIRALKAAPCADCGNEYEHYKMDFVRKDGERGVPVSKLLLKSKTTILQEARKCDLVCALCGRERIWRKQRAARMGPT